MDSSHNDVLFNEILTIPPYKKESCNELHLACIAKNYIAVKSALETNRVNDPVPYASNEWRGCTALHIAVIKNCHNITELLLQNGANITSKDAEGLTPLYHAILKRRDKILECILAFFLGKRQFSFCDTGGLTFLHVACMLKHSRFAKEFIQVTEDDNINLHTSKLSSIWPDFTPLHVAARYNRLETVRMLLSYGANLTAIATDEQNTPLHIAHSLGSRKMTDLLLLAHDGKVDPANARGLTSFHIACERGRCVAVSRFLQYQPRLQRAINTALRIAVDNRRANIVKLLVREHGMDLQKELRMSGFFGVDDRSYKLLDRLIRDNLYDFEGPFVYSRGFPLFHHACKKGYEKLAKVLLRHGADPNDEKRATTPLQLAIDKKRERIIKLLLDNGADPYAMTEISACNALEELVSTYSLSRKDTKEKLEKYYYKVISYLIEAGMTQDDVNRALRRSTINPIGTWALLQNGGDINCVSQRNGKSVLWHYFGGTSCFGDNLGTYSIFRTHLQKLRIIGLPISTENEELFKEVSKRYEREYMKTHKVDYTEECKEECKRLKMTKVGQYCSLYDLIFKGQNEMAMMMKNSELERIIKAKDFEQTYPMYGYLLKLQYRKGALRRPLIDGAMAQFQAIINSSFWANLPDSCILEIFNFMSNKELKFFATAK